MRYLLLIVICFTLPACGTKIGKKIGLISIDSSMHIIDNQDLLKPPFLENDLESIKDTGTK
ncbi:hypothetical protein CAXC1_70004 [Candidatus Xenohaliotis californiensis]|uniref:Lipoprotein n=1 Tax=Candidatus Xenohaliotis californiensis TaxID=84677 RepID=A0ABM9N976_9RICK|nr:hypothetical protein CAXC1_70004 [Candidatus Xenohaliotis californiensis]